MEFIGLENIPPYGPVIFTCNHMNQVSGPMSLLSHLSSSWMQL